VHEKQALVLVNYDSDFGADIISLAKYIQREIAEKFSVSITPEVRMITSQGERAFSTLPDTRPIESHRHD
jgi:UDP-N-acetylmuramate dehydrogenase